MSGVGVQPRSKASSYWNVNRRFSWSLSICNLNLRLWNYHNACFGKLGGTLYFIGCIRSFTSGYADILVFKNSPSRTEKLYNDEEDNLHNFEKHLRYCTSTNLSSLCPFELYFNSLELVGQSCWFLLVKQSKYLFFVYNEIYDIRGVFRKKQEY